MEGTKRPLLGCITCPPSLYTREDWYEVDPRGYVTRMLMMDKDANGNAIQQAALAGHYSVNFAQGSSGDKWDVRFRFTCDDITGMLPYANQQGP